MSIVKHSMFSHFFIYILIDALGQVLWVMAFIWPTPVYFAAGAPGGLFSFIDQDQKKPRYPDLLHHTALGVTFSYAKPIVHYSKIWPCTNVKVRNKHMLLRNRTERPYLFLGL